ncbi:MAG TPA: alpha-amylase family glycosyl hydrolase [Arachidicoccus sp.]|nr:alpha-amylase family glycosyl hydrolase [Arachidicoccus sp.]
MQLAFVQTSIKHNMSIRYPAVDWLAGANIYEVNIRQYTPEGTFKAFAKHLSRLKEMGVAILWFMPITPISQQKKKGSLGSYYACSSYTDINPEFGNKEDFKALIDQAHSLGFKVIIDWVANHTGWDHLWTSNPDWYRKDAQGNFTEIHGWDDVIDLNYDNMEMQSAMIEAMKYWIGLFDIDGFRCDMAHLVQLEFWSKARRSCEKIKKLLWLGECDEDNYSEVFDITYSWRWMHATENYAKDPGNFDQIKASLDGYYHLPPEAQKLYFTSNHDENSWNGTEYEKYGPLLSKTWAAFSFLFPGVPLIYSGQELPNKKRLLFFDKDQIEWSSTPIPQLAAFYSTLCTIRKSHPVYKDGMTMQWIKTEGGDSVLAFYLQRQQHKALILLNLSDTDQHAVPINGQLTADQLAGKFIHIAENQTARMVTPLPSDSVFELAAGAYQAYFSVD